MMGSRTTNKMNWIILIASIAVILGNFDKCTALQHTNQQNDDDFDVIPEHIIKRDFIDEIVESTDYLSVNKTKTERDPLLSPSTDDAPRFQHPQTDKRQRRRKKGHKRKHKRIKSVHSDHLPNRTDNTNLAVGTYHNERLGDGDSLMGPSTSHHRQPHDDNDNVLNSNLNSPIERNNNKRSNLPTTDDNNNDNTKVRSTKRRRKKKLPKSNNDVVVALVDNDNGVVASRKSNVDSQDADDASVVVRRRAEVRQQRLLEREERKLYREGIKEKRRNKQKMRQQKMTNNVTHELDNGQPMTNLDGTQRFTMTDFKTKAVPIGDLSCMKGRFQQAPVVVNADIKYLRNDINGIENAFMEAEYHCRDGYQLTFNSNDLNNTNLICSNGRWLGEKPTCEKIRKAQKNVCAQPNRCDQICLLQNGTERCMCYKGFRWTGQQCIDINECMENENICEFGCSNTVGSYRCKCPRGLRTGDANTCIDINECLLRNGHGPCQDTCTNLMGSYTCTCDSLAGTRLADDRHSCEDVDECGLNNGGCSHTCLNTLGRAFCVCPEGWMLDDDWKTCVDIDECSLEYQNSMKLEKRCDYGCINTLGSYRCIIEIGGADEAIIDDVPACPNGFYFNVTVDDCQDINECDYENGGCSDQCVNTDGSFVCTCRPGYVFGEDKKKCLVSNQTSDIACPPLFPPRHGYLECSRPLETVDGRNRITNRPGSQCILRCPTGFRVVGIFSKVCGTSGQWIGNGDGSCIRYPTPRLVCPKDVRVEVPPYETTISYHIPRPKTDVDFGRDVVVEPLWAKEGELKLKQGSKNVTFTAKHPLSKLTISCSFQINVLDGEAPKVEYCPETQKYSLAKRHESIKLTWPEPKFSDNINVTDVTRTNIPGNYFGLGSHQIIYEAKDAAGYRSRCVFKIIVNAPKHSGFSSLQLPILYNKFYRK